jgi:hypothetical protein
MKWVSSVSLSGILRAWVATLCAADLADIKARGDLRHLGIPYGNFMTGDDESLDIHILRLYCRQIGVEYRYVKTDLDNVFANLSGKRVSLKGDRVEIVTAATANGDIIGNGVTVIPWPKEAINYSTPYYPVGYVGGG